MPDQQLSLREQVSELFLQVETLKQRVLTLEQSANLDPVTSSPAPAKAPHQDKPQKPSESSILVSGSSLLKHISAICFLLVIGLGLRALAENDIFSNLAGTALGIGYAGLLIIGGFFLYRRTNSMAPLFTIIGAILMFSVLMETYTRHSLLPVGLVYLMLAMTGIALAMISFQQQAALPIIVGSLGMCLTAVAIDYPNPYFPYLGLMLWLSNILGFFASRIRRCSWLRWLLMLTTHFMLQVWGLKISGILSGTATPENIGAEWFIPIVTLIGFTFVLISLFGIIRSGDEKISKFDLTLPAINAAWLYVAGIYALKDPALFGIPAAIAAIFHFALAFWLAKRQRHNAPGTNTFTAGGVILAGLSLPALTGSMLLPLPLLSLLALGICVCSHAWKSGGMRMTSYVLQLYVVVVLLIEMLSTVTTQAVPLMTVALFCSWSALQHYSFSRETPPPLESIAFSRFDRHDLTAQLPLTSGLLSGLITCLAFGFFILNRNYLGDVTLAYTGLQSIIINGSAILLMIIAAMRHNKELRNISCLVLLLGGAKVFIYDMLQISGGWLVAGIFAFGTAAALQSLVLARWKAEPDTANTTKQQKKESL